MIHNLSNEHRIEKNLKYIANLPKIIEEEIATAQERMLKEILVYKEESLLTTIQSFLMLLHQKNIFSHLKYLDLVMFVVHNTATESGIGELDDYEAKFTDYCLYYTSSLTHTNSWFPGILQLKNTI